MDRQSLLGLSLIFAVVLAWAIFFPPTPPTPAKVAAADNATVAVQPDTVAAAQNEGSGEAGAVRPSGEPAAPKALDSTQARDRQFGAFASLAGGTARTIRVTTDKLDLLISTRGGRLQAVNLNEFKTHTGLPLPLLPDGSGTKLSVQFRHGSRIIDTGDLYFTSAQTTPLVIKGDQTATLTLRAELANGQAIEQSYTFTGNRYDVGYGLRLVGLGQLITNNNLELHAALDAPHTERNLTEQFNNTTVYYNYSDDIEKLSPTEHKEKQLKTEQGNIRWVAFKSMFFSVGLMPEKPFESVTIASEPHAPEMTLLTGSLKRLETYAQVRYSHSADEHINIKLYLGPADFNLLSKYPDHFDGQMELGWAFIGWINKYIVLNVFKWVESFTSNYGIVILCLAIFIKLLIFPLTYSSYLSTAKMQVVNNLPEVKELDEKFKDDPIALQNKKMAFYSSAGVNPMAGCLPLLLQLPILIAMFNFFPKSIELRQQAFWWADDLSSYDSIWNFGMSIPGIGNHLSGFALLMTISQLIYTYISQQGQNFTGPNASLKYMGYIFPVIFFAVLNSYSSGLSYYYLLINVMTIGQTYAIKAFVNEQAIKDRIHKTRTAKTKDGKPLARKPNGLMRWLEDQQKKQEAMVREQRQQKRGGR